MSGHSKWATIKHKKAATDAKRGKAFIMRGPCGRSSDEATWFSTNPR
jgi:hypothetical protein